jgi:hypothetical protein
MDLVPIFIFFRVLLLFILVVTGYNLSRPIKLRKMDYWIIAGISIISYSLIEGLRYNRGIDYDHYKKLYEKALNLGLYWKSDAIEPFFQLINKTFRILDAPYPVVFVFYSFILITSCLFFMKEHRKVALFAIPMFFMATIGQSENLVRQFMAFSFVLISLNYFFTNSWIKFSIWFLLALLTHTSCIIFLPFLFLFKFIKKPFGSLYVILGLYFISWLWKPEYWGKYYQYFQILQLGDNYQGYTENAEIWFSGDVLQEFTQSTFYLIRLFLFNTLMMILGYSLLERYRKLHFHYFYYLFVIGAILQHIVSKLEILNRLVLYFYMFWFIVLSYIVYDSISFKNRKSSTKIICRLLIVNVIYDYIISPLINVNANNTLFIWDIF